MLSNPGKTVTIYQVGQFVKDAYLAAFSPQNITQGFLKTGIYLLNSHIFCEDEFLSSFVTDRPDPSTEVHSTEKNLKSSLPAISTRSLPSTSGQIVLPEIVRPFSKAGRRQKPIRDSCKMSSAIITDSPEKRR